MPSINLDNLERYDSKARNEAEEEYMPKDSGNWQKTEEAGAVAFYPVPNTPLEGKVKFSFKETPPASGEKSPSNPSTITGVSSVTVTRCGKNLIPAASEGSTTVNGVTYSVDSNGIVTANGTASDSASFVVFNRLFVPAGTYCLSGCQANGSAGTYSLSFHKWGGSASRDYGTGSVVTVSEAGEYQIYITVSSGVTASNFVFKPQLELGSTATAFEPYAGTDYAIPLGNTYYGGTLDVASGVMTVTWEGDVLSASNFSTVGFSQSVVTNMVFVTSKAHGGGSATSPAVLTCNRFPTVSGSGDTEHCRFSGAGSGSALNVYIDRSRLDLSGAVDPANPTAAELKTAMIAWLETNPTLVVYQLSEPYTVQLTPTSISALAQTDKCTPRLNTVYTDADTIQIGYMKSPQRTEQEITQALLEIESNDSD